MDNQRDKIKMIENNKVDILLLLKFNSKEKINATYSMSDLIDKFPVA